MERNYEVEITDGTVEPYVPPATTIEAIGSLAATEGTWGNSIDGPVGQWRP